MAKITRCDRCGREYNEPMSLLPIRDGYTVVHNVGLNTEYVDLCEECKNELAYWLTNGDGSQLRRNAEGKQ